LVFVALAFLPYMHKPNCRGPQFRALHEVLAWAFMGDFLLLTYLGHQPVEAPYVFLGQTATVGFFLILGGLCFTAWADQWLAGVNTSKKLVK
jgi:ubiquinol-cytochrome c reductase cytochrome b subunit